MFIATKTINTENKSFFKGQEVPTEFVSDHLIQIGAVVLKEEPKVEAKEEPKVELKTVRPRQEIKPREVKPKKEILVEDSSKVKVTKESN